MNKTWGSGVRGSWPTTYVWLPSLRLRDSKLLSNFSIPKFCHTIPPWPRSLHLLICILLVSQRARPGLPRAGRNPSYFSSASIVFTGSRNRLAVRSVRRLHHEQPESFASAHSSVECVLDSVLRSKPVRQGDGSSVALIFFIGPLDLIFGEGQRANIMKSHVSERLD